MTLPDKSEAIYNTYQEPQKERRICVDCRFAEREEEWEQTITGKCLCESAPFSEYVYGERWCSDINAAGTCKYFEPKGE